MPGSKVHKHVDPLILHEHLLGLLEERGENSLTIENDNGKVLDVEKRGSNGLQIQAESDLGSHTFYWDDESLDLNPVNVTMDIPPPLEGAVRTEGGDLIFRILERNGKVLEEFEIPE